MKVRIDEVGYEHFTGQLGLVVFEDGVSVDSVSQGEINRMSVVVRLVEADNLEQIGSLVEINKHLDVDFPTNQDFQTEPESNEPAFVAVDGTIPVTVVTEEITREALEALADKEGIAGLREIADPLGVKAVSVVGLIDAILQAQMKA